MPSIATARPAGRLDVGDLEDAPDAGRAGGQLGPEVAAGLARRAHVAQDQPEQVLVDRAVPHEQRRRDDEPFLDVLLVEADAARRPATDVEVVGHRRDVRDDPAVAEDRHDRRDVVEVDAAEVAVVADEAVARAQPLGAVGRDDPRHEVGQRPEVGRLAERLGDDPARRIDDRARVVAARLDVGRVGRPLERDAHLVGDRGEPVAEDLLAEGVGAWQVHPSDRQPGGLHDRCRTSRQVRRLTRPRRTRRSPCGARTGRRAP